MITKVEGQTKEAVLQFRDELLAAVDEARTANEALGTAIQEMVGVVDNVDQFWEFAELPLIAVAMDICHNIDCEWSSFEDALDAVKSNLGNADDEIEELESDEVTEE